MLLGTIIMREIMQLFVRYRDVINTVFASSIRRSCTYLRDRSPIHPFAEERINIMLSWHYHVGENVAFRMCPPKRNRRAIPRVLTAYSFRPGRCRCSEIGTPFSRWTRFIPPRRTSFPVRGTRLRAVKTEITRRLYNIYISISMTI